MPTSGDVVVLVGDADLLAFDSSNLGLCQMSTHSQAVLDLRLLIIKGILGRLVNLFAVWLCQ